MFSAKSMHVLLMLIEIKKSEFLKNKGGAGLGKQLSCPKAPDF